MTGNIQKLEENKSPYSFVTRLCGCGADRRAPNDFPKGLKSTPPLPNGLHGGQQQSHRDKIWQDGAMVGAPAQEPALALFSAGTGAPASQTTSPCPQLPTTSCLPGDAAGFIPPTCAKGFEIAPWRAGRGTAMDLLAPGLLPRQEKGRWLVFTGGFKWRIISKSSH